MLTPEGRLFVWTFAPDHFTGHHLRTYLPDLPAIDLARFPSAETARERAAAAGFGDVRLRWFEQGGSVSRERAAEQLRARHLSTIHLLPPEQVDRGRGATRGRGGGRRPAVRDGAALAAASSLARSRSS